MSNNAAVWMDHEQARISRLSRGVIEHETVAVPEHVYHKHSNGSEGFQQHPEDTRHFFHKVARSLDGSHEILLVGIETVERPTDGRLAAFDREYFEECEGA